MTQKFDIEKIEKDINEARGQIKKMNFGLADYYLVKSLDKLLTLSNDLTDIKNNMVSE